jgi:hypothetical protein
MHEHTTGSGGFIRMNLGRNAGELKGQFHEIFRGNYSLSNSDNVNRKVSYIKDGDNICKFVILRYDKISSQNMHRKRENLPKLFGARNPRNCLGSFEQQKNVINYRLVRTGLRKNME